MNELWQTEVFLTYSLKLTVVHQSPKQYANVCFKVVLLGWNIFYGILSFVFDVGFDFRLTVQWRLLCVPTTMLLVILRK